MNHADRSTALIAAITDLQEETALALVRQRLDVGDDPLLVIKDCQEGLRQVGLRYERQQYSLAGLIMAGEIFREVMELVQPVVERRVIVVQLQSSILTTKDALQKHNKQEQPHAWRRKACQANSPCGN